MFSVLLTESPGALQALDLSADVIASEIEKHRSIARLKVRACSVHLYNYIPWNLR